MTTEKPVCFLAREPVICTTTAKKYANLFRGKRDAIIVKIDMWKFLSYQSSSSQKLRLSCSDEVTDMSWVKWDSKATPVPFFFHDTITVATAGEFKAELFVFKRIILILKIRKGKSVGGIDDGLWGDCLWEDQHCWSWDGGIDNRLWEDQHCWSWGGGLTIASERINTVDLGGLMITSEAEEKRGQVSIQLFSDNRVFFWMSNVCNSYMQEKWVTSVE